ncbi:MAG: hypothetical protein KGM43_12900, partial [Planctomycetota bacterium]|nr:hypothetical protein [Planctomycetota bacterium]
PAGVTLHSPGIEPSPKPSADDRKKSRRGSDPCISGPPSWNVEQPSTARRSQRAKCLALCLGIPAEARINKGLVLRREVIDAATAPSAQEIAVHFLFASR